MIIENLFANNHKEGRSADNISSDKEYISITKELALSKNALQVLKKRYLRKDETGTLIETPEDMFKRVSRNIASADIIYNRNANIAETEEEFYHIMASLDFLPNSPTLMNAGGRLQQLSACFVLPIEDSMESIFETIKDTAMIHKSGGGTGFNFSKLRPANSPVASTNGVSSGPISFMKVFDSATEAIKQGGTRRGANMGILRVDHPDIMDFIKCKNDNSKFNNFNISVAITESFMEAVDKNSQYDLIDPHTKKVAGKLEASKVFDSIVESAWKNGEPGIIFIDKINDDNPTPHIGVIESTNPCGEQPLLPYESCNLGSLNLSRMVKNKEIDFNKMRRVIHSAVHFLDNVIDMNKYPLNRIELMTKANRKIGLGVMGFADMLIMLGIPYDSDKAITTAEQVMSFISLEAKRASINLAKIRGPFPNFKGSLYDLTGHEPIRNATTTTIAPTGTISIIANSSSGIEPLFAISYIRKVMDNNELVETHPIFKEIAKKRGFYSDDMMIEIAKRGEIKDFDTIPEDIKKLFVTSHEVTPEHHINIQAAFQKFTDNAVSKTINFSHSAAKEDVAKAYIYAYKKGTKGITIYRDGSRDTQVLNTGRTERIQTENNNNGHNEALSSNANKAHNNKLTQADPLSVKITPKPRPQMTKGCTQRISTGCGNLYVTINEAEDGLPFEIFTHMGKAGGCSASQSEAIGRLISLALRSNIETETIVKQLKGISCHTHAWENGTKTLSCSDAIAKTIERYAVDKKPTAEEPKSLLTKIEKPKGNGNGNGNGNGKKDIEVSLEAISTMTVDMIGLCPTCYGLLERIEGCMLCRGCGYSKCD